MTTHLVLARHRESVLWAEQFSVESIIYTKDHEPQKLVVGLAFKRNVGREAHTYLHHILTRWDNLADWTVFCQADPLPHLLDGLEDLRWLLAPCDTAKFLYLMNNTCIGPDGRIAWDKVECKNAPGQDKGQWGKAWAKGDIRPAKLDFGAWLVEHLGDGPYHRARANQLFYTPGAIFGVSRSQIHGHPREFYQKLIVELEDHAHPEEAHYLERAWYSIFGAGAKVLYDYRNDGTLMRPARGNATGELPGRVVDSRVGKIFVCQPQYASGIPASHTAFRCQTGNKYPDKLFAPGGGSLLGASFNHLWATALNMQEAGEPITHFAMLHDDIVPMDDDWLDRLIDDLLETGADVMSAVVPIKDPLGLTSCAIDNPDDQFEVLRRITLTEVFNLPEVFGSEECGYPEGRLLVNTGCWVCDFTRPWRHAADDKGNLKVFFTIRDRVRRQTAPDGTQRYVASVAPEDWNFSRAVTAQGGKVMATRRVRLAHYGMIPFTNTEPWGTMTQDQLLAHRHGYHKISAPGHEHLRQKVDVSGWLTEDEGELLAELAAGKQVLEIGSYCGRSTIYMARVADIVYAVDTFDGRETPQPRDTINEFHNNLARYGVMGQVRTYRGTTAEALPLVEAEFDLIFIDGGHGAANVANDIRLALPKLRPTGLLVFHDYRTDEPGVYTNVNALLADGWEACRQANSVVALRRRPVGTFMQQAEQVYQQVRDSARNNFKEYRDRQLAGTGQPTGGG